MKIKTFIIILLTELSLCSKNSIPIKSLINITYKHSLDSNIVKSLTSQLSKEHPCELKTSIILNHLFNKTELPIEYQEYYKMLFYSGNGPNDLGDWISCTKMNISKYHTISLNESLSPSPIRLGLCFLKECDVDYLNNFKVQITILLKQYYNITVDPEFLVIRSPEEELNKLKRVSIIGFWVTIVIFGIIILLNILQCLFKARSNTKIVKLFVAVNDEQSSQSTKLIVSDEESHKSEIFFPKVSIFLNLFDFKHNIVKVFEVRKVNTNSLEALKIFDGIKFFSAFWIIHTHTTQSLIALAGVKNTTEIFTLIRSLPFSIWLSSHLSVDIFFYLAGFLVYLNIQKYLNKSINSPKLLFLAILDRIIRLYPLYLFAIFGMTYITPFVSNGPNYYLSLLRNISCGSKFWRNMLFIQNLFGSNPSNYESCVSHGWYLASDIQIFIITLIICFFLNRFEKIRTVIFVMLLISSRIYCFYDSYMNDSQGVDFNHHHDTKPGKDFFLDWYVKPWNSICGFILGIFFCQLFLETPLYKKDNLVVNNTEINILSRLNEFFFRNNWACHMISIIGLMCMIFAYFWGTIINNYEEGSRFWTAFYHSNCKLIFIFGIGIIIHFTFLGKLTFIKCLLSSKFFSSVSKLLYGVYLVHVYIMEMYILSIDSVPYLSIANITYIALGVGMVSIFVSLIITTLLESPIINAMKLNGRK